MIPHHQQAIEMSDMLLAKQGSTRESSELAKQIKNGQGPEIQQMQGWLTEVGSPQTPMPADMPGAPAYADAVRGHAWPRQHADHFRHAGYVGRPGCRDDVRQPTWRRLQNAQGVEASKLFLTQMIAHHEGAITMAQKELRTGQYPGGCRTGAVHRHLRSRRKSTL